MHHVQLDVLICTPTILSKYHPSVYPKIKVVATAGEPTSQDLADLWATHATYWNCCGPTETTIVNTMSKHIPGEPTSIGRPTPNNTVYILDEKSDPVGSCVGQRGLRVQAVMDELMGEKIDINGAFVVGIDIA